MKYLLIQDNNIISGFDDLEEAKLRADTLAKASSAKIFLYSCKNVVEHKTVFLPYKPEEKKIDNQEVEKTEPKDEDNTDITEIVEPIQPEEALKVEPVQPQVEKEILEPEIKAAFTIVSSTDSIEVKDQPIEPLDNQEENQMQSHAKAEEIQEEVELEQPYMTDNDFSAFLEDFQKALKNTDSLVDHAKVVNGQMFQNLLSQLSPEQAATIKVLRQKNNDRCAIKDLGVELCDVHNFDKLKNILSRYPEEYHEHHKDTIENLKKEFEPKTDKNKDVTTILDEIKNDEIPPYDSTNIPTIEDATKKKIRLALNNCMTLNAATSVKNNLKEEYPDYYDYIKEIYFKKAHTLPKAKEPIFASPDPSR